MNTSSTSTSVPKNFALNRCRQCGHKWIDLPGTLSKHAACPSCESLYWDWLNYQKDFAR